MTPDEARVIFFILVLIAAVSVVSLLADVFLKFQQVLILGLVGILFLTAIAKTGAILKLKEYERAVVLRIGRFAGVRGPGIVFIIPFIEEAIIVDTRARTINVGPQQVITKDHVAIVVDPVIYLRVTDPAKSVLNVKDYEKASVMFIQTALRDVIGGMTLEEVIANVEEINARLKRELEKVAKDWGVSVYSVELERIEPPKEIIEAMHERKRAEELKAAETYRAEAEKIRITAVAQATAGIDERTLLYYYIKALEGIARGKATKIIFPLEFSTLVKAVADQLEGIVPRKKVEEDLETKYRDLVEYFLKKMRKEGKES